MAEVIHSDSGREFKIDKKLTETLTSMNWETELVATVNFIKTLGDCMLLATFDPEMEQMQIDDKTLDHSSLVVNLSGLASEGDEAIAKKNGLIDEIVAGFRPAGSTADVSEASKLRAQFALQKLDIHVKESEIHGTKTQKKFMEWNEQIKILQKAIGQKKSNTMKEEASAKKNADDAEAKIENQEKQQGKLNVELAAAKEKVEKAIVRVEREKVRKQSEVLSYAAGVLSGGLALGVPTTALGVTAMALGAPAMALGVAYLAFCKIRDKEDYEHAKRAEENAKRLAEDIEQCTESMRIATESFLSAKSSAEKWESVHKAAKIIASKMAKIHGFVSDTMRYFRDLNTQILLLADIYRLESSLVVAEDSGAARDGNSGTNLKIDDIARQLRCAAHILHALSAVYAEISRDHIQRGFRLISSLSYDDDDEDEDEEITPQEERKKRKQGMLKDYLSTAQIEIKKKVYQASKIHTIPQY
ncbi:hypothetical protein TWF970_004491 [Orbilia oligospora]|uniref:Uncharacterized protein n=1 Tax=Orbilia oligospora TaxID=2813651 RepID=A0A7C8R7U5_ORBOL|nr:hypothetical protein TWF970_004491 [Orbilia oligospora]